MTYRERRLRKAERLREWAEKRQRKSAAAFQTARTIADGIPLGQPILVGHHSEKRHRRDVERIDNGMRRGVEHERKAGEMASRASNIEDAAADAIYSDDPDACDALRARLERLEAERARVKAVNKAVRAHGLQRLIQADPPFVLTVDEKRELLKLMQLTPYHHVETRGFPSYHLQNLGGNIARQRARLVQLERVEAQRARVAAVLADERDAKVKPEPATPEQAAAIAEVMTVIDAAYTAIAEDRDPVAAVLAEIEKAERAAPPIAEVPFSLTSTVGQSAGKQGGLF